MKILVATPVYDGKLPVQAVRCLLAEQVIAQGVGDEFQVLFLPSCSHPAMGRNQLAQQFLDSDADRLVFLDSDVTFDPGSLVKLAHHNAPLVGGAYRLKVSEEIYPIGWLNRPFLQANDQGLLEVMTLPGGFLAISREVFETYRKAYPGRDTDHMGQKNYCYFQTPFHDGHLVGEDSFFCLEYHSAGGKVYLDPEIQLTHWNNHEPFKGHIGNWLKSRGGSECQPQAI